MSTCFVQLCTWGKRLGAPSYSPFRFFLGAARPLLQAKFLTSKTKMEPGISQGHVETQEAGTASRVTGFGTTEQDQETH